MQRIFDNLHLISRKRIKSGRDGKDYSTDPNLAELLNACKAGDRLAQKKLYDSLASKMLPLCKRYMGDTQSAEDVLQEGFISLFSKLDKFEGKGSFEGWARRIFVNTALMQLRKGNSFIESEGHDGLEYVDGNEVSVVQKLGYEHLMELIESLPPGFRTVFNMYVIEGFSHKEIAQVLGISENTSRSQLQRARMLLQKKLREE